MYQHPASDFADHADAIEQSAADLVGVNLADLTTGAPSGQIITAADLAQVHKAMLAVEMRTPPTQCNFQPLLAQNPRGSLRAGTAFAFADLFKDTFDSGDAWLDHWTARATRGRRTSPSATGAVAGDLPDGRAGTGASSAPNPEHRHLRAGRTTRRRSCTRTPRR